MREKVKLILFWCNEYLDTLAKQIYTKAIKSKHSARRSNLMNTTQQELTEQQIIERSIAQLKARLPKHKNTPGFAAIQEEIERQTRELDARKASFRMEATSYEDIDPGMTRNHFA